MVYPDCQAIAAQEVGINMRLLHARLDNQAVNKSSGANLIGTDYYKNPEVLSSAHPSIREFTRADLAMWGDRGVSPWFARFIHYFSWMLPGALPRLICMLFVNRGLSSDPYGLNRPVSINASAYNRFLKKHMAEEHDTRKLQNYLKCLSPQNRIILKASIDLGVFPVYNARSEKIIQPPPYKYEAPARRNMAYKHYYHPLRVTASHVVWENDLNIYWQNYREAQDKTKAEGLDLIPHLPQIPHYNFGNVLATIGRLLSTNNIADVELQHYLYIHATRKAPNTRKDC